MPHKTPSDWSCVFGPKVKFSPSEIMNPIQFTVSYHSSSSSTQLLLLSLPPPPQTTCSRLNPVTTTFTTSTCCTSPLLKAPQGTISVNSRTYHIQCLAQWQDLLTFHSLLNEWVSERVGVWMVSVLSRHVDLLTVSPGGGQRYHPYVPLS